MRVENGKLKLSNAKIVGRGFTPAAKPPSDKGGGCRRQTEGEKTALQYCFLFLPHYFSLRLRSCRAGTPFRLVPKRGKGTLKGFPLEKPLGVGFMRYKLPLAPPENDSTSHLKSVESFS